MHWDCENTLEAGLNGPQDLGYGGGRWPVWKRTMAGALVDGRHSGPGKLVLIDVKRAEADLTLQETRATGRNEGRAECQRSPWAARRAVDKAVHE